MLKKSNRITIILIALICCIFTPFINNKSVFAHADGISEIAMELDHSYILCGKNIDRKLPMASTTKIMTALLICEDCNLDEEIEVPNEAV